MATKAFQKIYTKISQITKATCTLKATGVGADELAMVDGKLAQVVKIAGDEVTLQVFEGTGGIPTDAEVVFMGKAPVAFSMPMAIPSTEDRKWKGWKWKSAVRR